MLRLYRFMDVEEYKDFPNDLFQRVDYNIVFNFDWDQVTIDDVDYRISNILHFEGSGVNANSVESSMYNIKLINLKLVPVFMQFLQSIAAALQRR